MTQLFTNRNPIRHKAARPARLVAMLVATALLSVAPAVAQPSAARGHNLEGTWRIDLIGDPGFLTVKTSGFFTSDGSMFVQNAVPNIAPGMLILNGTGAWVRSGNRQFDLTWIYPVVSPIDGSYIGEFKDLARIYLNYDGTLTGVSTFAFTLADGTVAFAGSQKVKMVRLRVEPMP